MTRDRRDAGSGFLLVEALTAMAIGALLLLALGSLVSLVTRAADRTATAAQAAEETSRIFATLIGRVETVTPQRWAGAGAGFVFEGSETGLIFARFARAGEATTGSRLVLWDGDGAGLRERDVPLPPDAREPGDALARTPPDAVAESLLVRPAFTVRFAYYQRLANGSEALTDRWSLSSALPVAIRVTLTDRQGRQRGSVRMPIRIDAEPGCAAPDQGQCSLRPRENDGSALQTSPKAVDPDDPRGWEGYTRP